MHPSTLLVMRTLPPPPRPSPPPGHLVLHYNGGIDLYRIFFPLYLLQLLSLEQLESVLSLVKMDLILGEFICKR